MRLADLHVDTLNRSLERGWDLFAGSSDAHVDVPRIRAAGIGFLGMSLFTDPGPDAPGRCRRQLALARTLTTRAPDEFHLLQTLRDVASVEENGRVGLLLTVEGAHGVEDSLEIMDEFFQAGVRGLTLTWNNSNGLAGSSLDPSGRGLTALGRSFVSFFEERGGIIDLSHVSTSTFWDVMERAADRVWVTHAGCEALADHPRNLTDEQIRALGEAGSVLGIAVYPDFLDPGDPGAVTLETVADHVEHAARVAGAGAVAIGSDFDGISRLPRGMAGVQDLPRLLETLERRGWSGEMLEKLAWSNGLRVVKRLLPDAA